MKAKALFVLLVLNLFSAYCQVKVGNRETVLDSIIYLSDTIYDTIPSLPRLCDELSIPKFTIPINGCDFYVEVEGQGIPMVLINGGPGGTHHYFHPWFSAFNKTHKVIYYDQRGTGQSGFVPGEEGYSFFQAKEDLEGLREALGISKWIVCGYSYGGLLAQYYAASYPEKVSGMVLISALPSFKDDRFKSEQQKYISQVEKDRFKEITTKAIEAKNKGELNFSAFLYNMALNGDWKRQNFHKPTEEQMIRSALYEWVNDRNFNSIMSKSAKQYEFKGLFKNCPLPILLMEGKYDLTWGSEKAVIFRQEFPNAKYAFFEDSGHGIFKDEPILFAEVVSQFSKKLSPINSEQVQSWKQQAKPYLRPKKE
ncbi:MAG: alpha/beta hydrolase [Bacteroidota bacterium]